MNWNQLIEKILKMTPEQRQTDVTVHDVDSDEYYKVDDLNITNDTGVLDDGHPVLAFNI